MKVAVDMQDFKIDRTVVVVFVVVIGGVDVVWKRVFLEGVSLIKWACVYC